MKRNNPNRQGCPGGNRMDRARAALFLMNGGIPDEKSNQGERKGGHSGCDGVH